MTRSYPPTIYKVFKEMSLKFSLLLHHCHSNDAILGHSCPNNRAKTLFPDSIKNIF